MTVSRRGFLGALAALAGGAKLIDSAPVRTVMPVTGHMVELTGLPILPLGPQAILNNLAANRRTLDLSEWLDRQWLEPCEWDAAGRPVDWRVRAKRGDVPRPVRNMVKP